MHVEGKRREHAPILNANDVHPQSIIIIEDDVWRFDDVKDCHAVVAPERV